MFKSLAVFSLLKKISPNNLTECYRILTAEHSTIQRRCRRLLSTSLSCSSIFNEPQPQHVDPEDYLPELGQPIESWYYDVEKDGKITVRSLLDVHIQPLDPQKYPDMNKLFISIVYVGKDKADSSYLFDITKQYIINVDLDDNNQDVELTIKQKTERKLDALCHIQVPISYGMLLASCIIVLFFNLHV